MSAQRMNPENPAAVSAAPIDRADEVVSHIESIYCPTPEERRRARRIGCQAPLNIEPLGECESSGELMTQLQDYSATGLGLVAPRFMAAGEEFYVRLTGPGQSRVGVVCRVVHCRSVDAGIFQVGAEFVRVVDCSPHRKTPSGIALDWLTAASAPAKSAA